MRNFFRVLYQLRNDIKKHWEVVLEEILIKYKWTYEY